MDSGSGSMQSSSGGDDESYDSRAESISALLGPAMTNHHHPLQVLQQQQQQQLHHQHRQQHQVEFDSLSSMFDSRLVNNNPNNPLLNLDTVWSKTLRSDPSMADLGGHNDLSQPFLTNSQLGGEVSTRVSGGGGVGVGGGPSTFTHQIPSSSSAPTDQTNSSNNNNVGSVRNSNPKKRSRASRRAPTTVLTTDTSNFRAMVQEFTGIPAPPFTSTSPFARTRLDLFAGSSNSSSMAARSGQNHMDPASSSLPPYLLRPFAHRPPLLPSHPSSSNNSSTTSNIGGGGSNLQHSHSPLLNMNNMQNSPSSPSPVLNFQSLFQPQQPNLPKYPSPGSANILGSSKSQGSLGVLEDQFGLSHGLNNVQLPNIVSSDGGRMTVQARHDSYPRTTTTTTSTMNWVDNNSNNKDDGIVDHQHLLRSVNYATASSSLNVEKSGVQENNVTNTTATTTTTARNEGMVESWICSSD